MLTSYAQQRLLVFPEGVTVSAIEKGLMGRFLIFIGDGNRKARREHPTRLDHSVIGQLQA